MVNQSVVYRLKYSISSAEGINDVASAISEEVLWEGIGTLGSHPSIAGDVINFLQGDKSTYQFVHYISFTPSIIRERGSTFEELEAGRKAELEGKFGDNKIEYKVIDLAKIIEAYESSLIKVKPEVPDEDEDLPF